MHQTFLTETDTSLCKTWYRSVYYGTLNASVDFFTYPTGLQDETAGMCKVTPSNPSVCGLTVINAARLYESLSHYSFAQAVQRRGMI